MAVNFTKLPEQLRGATPISEACCARRFALGRYGGPDPINWLRPVKDKHAAERQAAVTSPNARMTVPSLIGALPRSVLRRVSEVIEADRRGNRSERSFLLSWWPGRLHLPACSDVVLETALGVPVTMWPV
jgi:hypothetical protein